MTVGKRDLKTKSLTNWKKIDSMRDEDIGMSDIPELEDSFFKSSELFLTKRKVAAPCAVAADVIKLLRTKGKGYQTLSGIRGTQHLIHPTLNSLRRLFVFGPGF